MPLHCLGVAARQDKGCTDAALRADGAEYPGRLRALINERSGPTSPWRPAPGGFGFLTDPSFVLSSDFCPGADREPVAELRHFGGEVFKILNGKLVLALVTGAGRYDGGGPIF